MTLKSGYKAVRADRWFKNGDHPEDGGGETEGKVVRFYRNPFFSGETVCHFCEETLHDHGFIDGPSGHVVCPGDWVITTDDGSRYPLKDHAFHCDHTRLDAGEA